MDMILSIKVVLIMGKLGAVDLLKRVDIPSRLYLLVTSQLNAN